MILSGRQKEELQTWLQSPVAFGELLAAHTSIRIGGPAAAMVHPENIKELVAVQQWCQREKLPYVVLGKGSNTLVKDGGYPGIVFQLSGPFKEMQIVDQTPEGVTIVVGGAVPTQQLVRWGATLGLQGVECLAGIPGTLGGNVMMNAGTSLGDVGALIQEVVFIDPKGKERHWNREECRFTYRHCAIPSGSIVVRAQLHCIPGASEKVEEAVRTVFEKRGLTQPIAQPNLGSVFKNPSAPGKTGKGGNKAWQLIDEAGLRGVRVGHARISEKHTNFIVNEGRATARDVLVLIQLAKEKVKETSGIVLETEVKIIGEDAA